MGRAPDPYATDSLLKLIKKEAKLDHRDLLMSCGEIISVAVMADLLESSGIPAETLCLDNIGITTDSRHGNSQILEINPASIVAALNQGKTVVIPGFQRRT